MNPPILFRSLAKSEYELAAVWYDEARAGLGIEFETAVEAVLTEVAASPERFPIADGDVREAPVPGFPYCIYYRFRRRVPGAMPTAFWVGMDERAGNRRPTRSAINIAAR